MKKLNRFGITCAPVVVFICALSISAQLNKKPYTEWSEKDARKVLDNSPWAQTQVFSDTSNEFGKGIGRGANGTTDSSSGDYSAHYLNIRIRLLSARPVRQAFARIITLMQKGQVSEQLAAQLKGFATKDASDYIAVAVDCDAKESKSELREFRTLLDNRTLVDLKNNTYISGTGGERVYIGAYRPPSADNLGAQFLFPRLINGAPFITPSSEEIHFYSEISTKYILNMRYKVKDMMFDGKLEY